MLKTVLDRLGQVPCGLSSYPRWFSEWNGRPFRVDDGQYQLQGQGGGIRCRCRRRRWPTQAAAAAIFNTGTELTQADQVSDEVLSSHHLTAPNLNDKHAGLVLQAILISDISGARGPACCRPFSARNTAQASRHLLRAVALAALPPRGFRSRRANAGTYYWAHYSLFHAFFHWLRPEGYTAHMHVVMVFSQHIFSFSGCVRLQTT